MRASHILIVTALLSTALAATAQSSGGSSAPASPDAGMVRQPKGADSSGDSGAVVVPPATDSRSVATPPKNVDPGMDDATGSIDAKNRKQTEDKTMPGSEAKRRQRQSGEPK